MVFVLQTQPKSWLTGYTFWVNHYLEIVFSKILVVAHDQGLLEKHICRIIPYPRAIFPGLSKSDNGDVRKLG